MLLALQGWKPIEVLELGSGARDQVMLSFLQEGSHFKDKKPKGSATFAGTSAAKGSAGSLCTGSSTAHGDWYCDSLGIIILIPSLKAQLRSRM